MAPGFDIAQGSVVTTTIADNSGVYSQPYSQPATSAVQASIPSSTGAPPMGATYRILDPVATSAASTYQQSVIHMAPITTPSAGTSGLRSAPLHSMDSSVVIDYADIMASSAGDDLQTPVVTPHRQDVPFASPSLSMFDSPRTLMGYRPSESQPERPAGEEDPVGSRDDGATGDDAKRRRDDGNDDNV